MTLRNNSKPEAAFKALLMVTRPPAVVHRFLFYISKLEILKQSLTLLHYLQHECVELTALAIE